MIFSLLILSGNCISHFDISHANLFLYKFSYKVFGISILYNLRSGFIFLYLIASRMFGLNHDPALPLIAIGSFSLSTVFHSALYKDINSVF